MGGAGAPGAKNFRGFFILSLGACLSACGCVGDAGGHPVLAGTFALWAKGASSLPDSAPNTSTSRQTSSRARQQVGERGGFVFGLSFAPGVVVLGGVEYKWVFIFF
jgi:hypothetical protein